MGDSVITVPSVEEAVTMIQSSRPSIIGRVRTCSSLSFLDWSLVVISLITIITGFGFSIYRWCTLPADSPDLVFSILVVVNLCFATFYLFHGIFQQQPFEILTLILTTLLLWILMIVNYVSSLSSNSTTSLKLVRFLVASVITLPNLVLGGIVAWKYWTSGNLVFKTVGADTKLQHICRQLLFELSLLTFDCQAALSCLILVMQEGLSNMTHAQIFIVLTGGIYVLIWIMLGYVAMRTENIALSWLFAIASLPQFLYVIYLFVQAMDIITENRFSVLSVCIYVSGVTLTSTHLILLTMLPVIAGNYGKGLREKIYGVIPSSQRPQASGSGSVSAGDSATSTSALLRRAAARRDDHLNYDSITVLPD